MSDPTPTTPETPQPAGETPKRMLPDWERIEAQYRAGVLTNYEIARLDGWVSESGIRKRAKKEGWTKDLRSLVQQRADRLQREQEIRAAKLDIQRLPNDREIVEASAQAIVRVRSEHREVIGRIRLLIEKLLGETEKNASPDAVLDDGDETSTDDLHAAVREATPGAHREKRRQLRERILNATALSTRITNTRQLAETLKTVIAMEREAYGLTANQVETPPTPPVAEQDAMQGAVVMQPAEAYLKLIRGPAA